MFLTHRVWDHHRLRVQLQQRIAARHAPAPGVGRCGDDLGLIGLIDETGTPKKGPMTPGVQRQYCGASGKIDNCIVTVHLGCSHGGFLALLDSELFLPQGWAQDRHRCREADIPDDLDYRPKTAIALELIRRAIGNGLRFDWQVFDEGYGKDPSFLFGLDALGQTWIGEIPKSFRCWPVLPQYHSQRKEFASKKACNVVRWSQKFIYQQWQTLTFPRQTTTPAVWDVKAAQVHLSRNGWPTDQPCANPAIQALTQSIFPQAEQAVSERTREVEATPGNRSVSGPRTPEEAAMLQSQMQEQQLRQQFAHQSKLYEYQQQTAHEYDPVYQAYRGARDLMLRQGMDPALANLYGYGLSTFMANAPDLMAKSMGANGMVDPISMVRTFDEDVKKVGKEVTGPGTSDSVGTQYRNIFIPNGPDSGWGMVASMYGYEDPKTGRPIDASFFSVHGLVPELLPGKDDATTRGKIQSTRAASSLDSSSHANPPGSMVAA